jgi:thiol-disulfide isomerase/thioredoxin
MVLALLAAVAAPSRAGDPTPTTSPNENSFAALKKAYTDATKAYHEEFEAALAAAEAKGAAALKAFKFEKRRPGYAFAPKFLAVAEKDPEGPDAVDALELAMRYSSSDTGNAPEIRARAIKILQEHYVTKAEIKGFVRQLAMTEEPGARKVLDDVIARNPDRKVQAAAYKALIAYREYLIRFAEMAKDKDRAAMIEKSEGKEAMNQRLARAALAQGEIEAMKKTLREEYQGSFHDLSVGQTAPEFVTQDVDGKPVKLGDLKGKVVVLDVWATWCVPCTAMIPHEREMVSRLEGKPFRLVGLSIDDDVKTLKNFLAKEKLPWTHWWAGPGGAESSFMQDWDIRGIPAIFVLDGEGVIRYRNVRGDELEKAVNALLKEAEAKAAG